MRVLLFDAATDGHHLEYAGYVARYLRERGDEAIFATWAPPSIPFPPELAEPLGDVRFLAGSLGRLGESVPWPVSTLWSIRRCARLAKRERADVIHFLYIDRSELAILATLGRRSTKPPIAFATLFWPYYFHHRGQRVSMAKRLFHFGSLKALAALVGQGTVASLFVHSERIKNMLSENATAPLPPDRIRIVPDPAHEPPPLSQKTARADLGLPVDKTIILFFGRSRPDKGARFLLSALPGLEGDWIAVFAGFAGDVGVAEAEACRSQLRDPSQLVTRFDFIPEPDADRYLRAADVVVLPYTTAFKGTSGVLQRAAASGKPVVATDVGDVGPVVRRFGLGLVIAPESSIELRDALRRFLASRDDIARDVTPRAHAYARANDWRQLGKVIREAYMAALGVAVAGTENGLS